jgi:hypothetical protein
MNESSSVLTRFSDSSFIIHPSSFLLLASAPPGEASLVRLINKRH